MKVTKSFSTVYNMQFSQDEAALLETLAQYDTSIPEMLAEDDEIEAKAVERFLAELRFGIQRAEV